MRFKAPTPTPPGLWRRTPPAVFPPIMGLFGLGLAWRMAARGLGVPAAVGEAVLGGVSLLFVFAAVAYGVKLSRRPSVVVDDLRVLPGRAGLSTAVLSVYLLAATLIPYVPALADWILLAGLALHVGLVAALILAFATGPREQRRITPVWHLSFVGFIVAAVAAAELGREGLALLLFGATTVMAALIWSVSFEQFLKEDVPPPLRPLLMIHLSPVALFGLVASALGLEAVALGCGAVSMVFVAIFLIAGRWMTKAGFSPLWGAFTFPAAATASLWLTLGGAWSLAGGLLLATVTVANPVIAFRVLRLWAQGHLAVKTNAAAA